MSNHAHRGMAAKVNILKAQLGGARSHPQSCASRTPILNEGLATISSPQAIPQKLP